MFEAWEDYYLLVGSAAAALIGLLFVVMSLLAGRERSTIEAGARFYMTPIVFDLGSIVVLSGAAMAPLLPSVLGWMIIATGFVSLVIDLKISFGIGQLVVASENRTFDTIWYGVVPAAISAVMIGAGVGLVLHDAWAVLAIAAVLMALLLVCIHNAWDLVTYITPQAGPAAEEAPTKPKPKARARRR
jgi:hypothetical protein